MKTTFFTLATATIALSVHALPHHIKRAETIKDTTILNFALTLEHLENAFYQEALAQFDENAFAAAGLPSEARGRFVEIGEHEKTHVAFLSAALGDNATQPCTYKFPYTDPKSFAALSQTLEGVGVSAYTGAAKLITNKAYLTAAASVLATEARHASWVASAINKFAGWSGPFDVPLGLNEVYTLAASFIASCPSTNPTLPVKAFPALTFPSNAAPGSSVPVSFNSTTTSSDDQLYVAFFTGLSKEFASINDGNVTIPDDLRGQVYAVVSNNGTVVNDDTIVAGPAILQFEFDDAGNVMAA